MRIFTPFYRALYLLPLLCTTLSAIPTAQAEETQWYEVEIIVFAHAKESYYSSENWKQDLILPQYTGAKTLTPGDAAGSKAFQALDVSRYRLNDEWNRLKNSGDYRPLIHAAWLQPGLAREQAIGVVLESGAASESLGGEKPLSGVVKVGLSRYLHLDVNLLYRKELKTESADMAPAFETFHLSESRRMRSRETHYLDHPMFGVIALITPVQ